MAEYAHITNGIVDNIIVIEQEMLDTGLWGDPSEWVLNDPQLKKNQARLGSSYDVENDAFINPKDAGLDSWTLDAEFKWKAPVEIPKDGKAYDWKEDIQAWVEPQTAKEILK